MNDPNNLEEFQDPVNYDLEEEARSAPRAKFYADLAESTGGPALELACGTGIVTLPIAARGIPVIGTDLARPMLVHAQRKAQERQLSVDWIEADARHLHLKRQFSYILLTGNAFQAFLHRTDQERLLATVKRHLAPDGIFAFETRNPSGHDLNDQTEEEHWFTYTSSEDHAVSVSGTQQFDPLSQVLHWTSYRRWTDSQKEHTKITRIACRFTYPRELELLLHYNGFRILTQYGDWQKNPLTEQSEHMISLCQPMTL